ncbi:RagB/SusD family nutrient uptake outer membrane protein [Ilyomonas limi]|uniref:RagB/SusD family nutrient uptake outer membrane protein n=1 Tax=Ilyomonas limi TaxID=2575867 RepID=A0A4U3L3Q8_9BACT|nr:RagB/SusD family nutrient uptake outer membrane protein [Ilyomonas limi]TKK68216.1 RagB/SusD family nutrient uptake outer membrane protein [Ilyomonas limi]
MKKILSHTSIFLLLIAVILCFNNCTKKLTEKVYSENTPGNFYQTANQVVAAYVLPYSFLQTHIYQVHFQVTEFTTDEACVPVLFGYIDQEGQWIRLHKHTWAAQDAWILAEWQNMFQAIGYCNNFIDNIQNVDVSTMSLPVSKEQMIAEARMVRALHYYWAWSDFGNIPIVEHVGGANPTNNTAADVFKFIEKEIKESIPALSEKGDDNWYGHFTKTAAYALLAKLYLNAQSVTGEDHYQDCLDACNYIISSNKYELDAHWNDPFRVHNENSNENIYVVPFDANNAQNFNFIEQNIHENIINARYSEDHSVWYGWRKISTEASFYNLYSKKDARINQWIVGPQTYVDENGDTQPIYNWSDEEMVITPEIGDLMDANDNEGVMNIKYEIEQNFGNYGVNGFVNMNNDMVVFRYADILYMKAECLMRLNGGAATQEAVDLVNQVRKRNFSASDFDKEKYTTASLTLDELLNERGREFAYEMFRREDLIRFGKFQDAWWAKEQDPDKHYELFPIPFTVITANPALQQNQGY